MLKIKLTVHQFMDDVEKLTLENILHYIKVNFPYSVHFFTKNDELIKQFSLQSATKKKGFIYTDKPFHYIFVKKSLRSNEKIKVLVHEIGHLLLDTESLNDKQNEINANLFLNNVLNYKKSELHLFKIWKQKYKILVFSVLSLLLFNVRFCFGISQAQKDNIINATQTEQSVSIEEVSKVYVTPYGKKYHLYDCRYVNLLTAEEMTIEEAEKNYMPCKRCIQKIH